MRRAPLLQRGGWGFESLAADMPLKLSSAEQPPCKRKAVGSIPTWGSDVGEPMVPPRAPSLGACTGRPSLGLPGGEAALRPRRVANGRPSSTSSPRSPTWQRHPAQNRTSRGSNPRGGTQRCDVVQSAGRPAVTRTTLVRPQPSQLVPRSSNGRIFGSEPKDAWFESRPRSSYGRGHGVHAVSNTAGEGSIPSVRASRPGRLVGQDAGLSHR